MSSFSKLFHNRERKIDYWGRERVLFCQDTWKKIRGRELRWSQRESSACGLSFTTRPLSALRDPDIPQSPPSIESAVSETLECI